MSERRRPKTDAEAKTYSFQVEALISLSVQVDARSLDEAIQKAHRASVQGLCHQCANGRHGEWHTSGELDCCPAECELVDVTVEGESTADLLKAAKEKWG